MQSLGFKLFKDPDLNYELVSGDLKVALNTRNQPSQTLTVYFGAWDEYDPATQKYTRTKLTLGDNDTFLWTLVRLADDGVGGTIEELAVEFVKSVAVTVPDEDDVTELVPNNHVANFYYTDEGDKKLSTSTENILYGYFNVGEYKYGWSTSTNAEAGGFRLAKRDPLDVTNEIIMTRKDIYGVTSTHMDDRFVTFQHGDVIPVGWYVKDFWADVYNDPDTNVTTQNDIIPRARTIQSGIPNKIRLDVTLEIPAGYTGGGQDFNFLFRVFGLKNVLIEKIEL